MRAGAAPRDSTPERLSDRVCLSVMARIGIVALLLAVAAFAALETWLALAARQGQREVAVGAGCASGPAPHETARLAPCGP